MFFQEINTTLEKDSNVLWKNLTHYPNRTTMGWVRFRLKEVHMDLDRYTRSTQLNTQVHDLASFILSQTAQHWTGKVSTMQKFNHDRRTHF